MYIGIAKLKLIIPANQSLKDKRRVIQSIIQKVRSRFSVAINEIDSHDQWQISELGIVCVSNDSKPTRQLLDQIINFFIDNQGKFELVDHSIDVIIHP